MTLKALIFDVDGTLAETEEAHRAAFNRVFSEEGLGWHWSVEDYRALLKTTGGKERMRAFCGMPEAGDVTLSDAEIARIHRVKTGYYVDILAQGDLPLRDGVREVISAARAKGLRVAVATTTSRENVEALCQCCWGASGAAVFDVIAAGDEVQAKKPAGDVYELALARLGLRGEDCVALEDSGNGVLSACAVGIPVVVTPSVYTEADDFSGAEAVVPSLRGDDLAATRLAGLVG
ncbi:HAD-IA family hydrolase [Shimia sp. FJ5]|uniref:HAD-IA family hydrolase n=1 Tax=Shimia sp. FJ5 TaxID=3079054 RepID=UPI00263783A3|nr:HAD-IA family hydrolase [Shimia sp. FJ5]MDV4145404.1 HAD-IA family hydrolase [Shimia sp. FJ5]